MRTRISFVETLSVISLLFGLFFGSGNLIFPISLGQMAGSNVWPASLGFLVTAVGMPLLGVVALGLSRCDGVLELSSKVGRAYSVFFTCALYLSIGPLFVAPRCITVPFDVGVVPMLPQGVNPKVALFIFSAAMFIALLWFSLRPSAILTWVGRVLNPMLLIMLGWLLISALLNPMGSPAAIQPEKAYATGAFARGVLEGYNTMDTVAALAFGIIVINVLRGLGVEDAEAIAANVINAGVFSCAFMGLIYIAMTQLGAQSRAVYPLAENGGLALGVISRHYFTGFGALFLALTVLLACLKTAIGLIVSNAQTFSEMFPNALSYNKWVVLFCCISFGLANLGLSTIIKFSLPILLTLYPLAITLILMVLWEHFRGCSKRTFAVVTAFTAVGAVLDTLCMMPDVSKLFHAQALVEFAARVMPMASYNMIWITTAAAGTVVAVLLPKKN